MGDALKVSLLGFITTLIGGWHFTIKILMIFICVDLISGVIKAIKNGQYTSRALRNGILGKSGFFLVLILAFQTDILIGNSEPIVRIGTTIFYIGVEGSSILENLGELGVPIPKFIVNKLKNLREMSDNIEDSIER